MLADALRASFSILKGIMTVLVVLYLFSNVRTIGNHEQALRLRLGRLLPGVHDPGLMWAFPFPIDEIVPLPTRKSNELKIESHTFHRREGEVGERNTMKLIVGGAHNVTEATPVVQDGNADRFTAYAYDEDNAPIAIEPIIYGSLQVEGGPPVAGEEIKGQLTIRRQGPEGEQGLDCRFRAVVEAPDI